MKRPVDDLVELERGLAIDLVREEHGRCKVRITKRGVVEYQPRGAWDWHSVGTVEQVLREAAATASRPRVGRSAVRR